jgi:hypothetical protein
MPSARFAVRAFCLAAVAVTLLWPRESFAQRTSVARDFPIYDNGGKPDLALDPQRFVAQMEIIDRVFAPDDCAIAEGVVGGAGIRRLLRFDTVLMNRGDGDLLVGDRSDPNNPYAPYFVFHECHGHTSERGTHKASSRRVLVHFLSSHLARDVEEAADQQVSTRPDAKVHAGGTSAARLRRSCGRPHDADGNMRRGSRPEPRRVDRSGKSGLVEVPELRRRGHATELDHRRQNLPTRPRAISSCSRSRSTQPPGRAEWS